MDNLNYIYVINGSKDVIKLINIYLPMIVSLIYLLWKSKSYGKEFTFNLFIIDNDYISFISK
jgi:hypothetical protein